MDSRTCTGCLAEFPLDHFARDTKGKDGRRSRCPACIKKKRRRDVDPNSKRRGERRRTRNPAPPERRARRRIQTEVESGLRPHANELPCADCGSMPDGTKNREHEYDHINGYEPPNDTLVEPVCKKPCHANRTKAREAKSSPPIEPAF